MAIQCDHPRPRLDLPGYVPRRMAWQVPGNIPGLPVEAARAIQQALQGVYNELSRQGQTRNVIPLVEDLFVQPGSVVVGVGNGQTVTLLPPGATGYLDPASVVLTDVVDPVTVLYPDGSSVELGEPGTYDFTPAGADTYETVPGAASGSVTTAMLADDSVTNAKLAEMAANTIKVNATAVTANPTDLAIPTFSVLGRRGANIETISTTEFVATGRRVFLKTGATGTPGSPLGFGAISIGDLPVMNDGQVYMNTSGVNGSAPSFKDGSSLAGSGGGLTWTGTPTYALSITANGVTDAMLRQSVGTSVIGRSAGTTGNVADITASADDTMLARVGGVLGFSTLTVGMIPAGIIPLSKLAGISGNTVVGNDSAITANPVEISVGTNTVLGRVGGNIVATQVVTAQIADLSITTAKLANANVTDAKISNRSALSVFGRSANSSGVGADITAVAAAGSVLRESGSTIGFGTIATAGITDAAVTNAKIANRTALSVFGRSANSSGVGADIAATAASDAVLRESGSVLGFGTIATAGIANNAVTDAKLRQGAALTVVGRSANSTGNVADIAAVAASGGVLRESGSTIGFGTIATAGLADASVTLAKLANLAAGTVIGRQIDASTGVPVALTGAEQGENLRVNTRQTVTTASGTLDVTLNDDTTVLVIQLAADATLRSMSNTATGDGRLLRIEHDSGAGFTLTLGHNLATPTFFPLYNSDEADMQVRRGSTVVYRARSGFWRPEYPSTRMRVRKNSTGTVFDRGRFNLIEGTGQTLTVADDPTNNEVDITVALTANGVADVSLRQSSGLSLIGRSTSTTGNVADITSLSGSGSVMRESGGAINWGTVATAGITDAAITLAKMANLAQSTIIGRAEGAGTGVPTALTATQVVSVIDQENVTWSGNFTYTGTNALTVQSGGGVRIVGSGSGGHLLIDERASAPVSVTAAGSFWVKNDTPNVPHFVDDASTDHELVMMDTPIVAWTGAHSFGHRFNLTGVISSTETGPVDNKAIGNVSIWRLTASASPVLLRGMVASSTGQLVWVFNLDTVNNIQVQPEDTSSSAANRFSLSGTSFNIGPLRGFPFWYDNTSSRWRPAALY